MTALPTTVTLEELQRLAAEVGERTGWDFSRIRMDREPRPWTYSQVVRTYLRPTDRVLDVGTGGGERFLAFADAYASGVGVDHDPEMVNAARRNRPDSLRDRVEFRQLDARDLAFDEATFDVALTRHARIDPEQIVKVLKPGGYFIGKQVGHYPNQLIWDAFGWGNEGAYWQRVAVGEGEGPFPTIDEYAQHFANLGCRVVAQAHSDIRAWFTDLESLVFYLKAAPFPEDFDPAKHLEPFNRLLARSATERGYETNEDSDLLVVQKR